MSYKSLKMKNKNRIIITLFIGVILLFITSFGFSQSISTPQKTNIISGKDTSEFLPDSNQKVNVAFRKVKKNDVTGFITTLNAAKIAKYDHTIWVNDVFSGRTLGLLGTQPIRGLGRGISIENISGNPYTGHPVVIVDGLPRNMGTLRLSEVKSITVLRDVNSAILYGSDAINGVILINTKRGAAFKNQANFNVNYGISAPKALPRYLNSADYMTYYNQALTNDGLPAKYSDSLVEAYRTGNRYRNPDVDYYSRKYLRPFKNYFDVNGQFSGGNNVAQYYANLGWNSTGSLLNFGEGSKARDNKFNVRGNVDLKVNDWIKTGIDVTGFFVDDKGPTGDYWGDAASLRPNEYAPLLPIDLIDPGNKLLLARKNDVNGLYLLGGNSNHLSTPFGDGYSGGVFEGIERKFSFNNRINVDLNKVTKGLSFHTNISFDYYVNYNQTVNNQYSVYQPVWGTKEDSIVDLTQYGKDSRSGVQSVGDTYFRRRFGAYGLFSYNRIFNKLHHFTGSLLGYLSNFKEQGDFQGIKQAHLGLQLGYIYNEKYMIDFSNAYVNSVKLAKGHRGGFSPSLSLAWVISKEGFMGSAHNIDYLKLKVSGGIMKSDFPIGGFFYYDSRYATSGSYRWDEGTRSRSGVKSDWNSNPDLGYTDRKEVNLGLQGLFFNKHFGAQANLFYDVYDNLVTRPSTQFPDFYSDFIPYENFGANEYYGGEAGLNLNESFGKWSLFIGANLLYTNSKRTKVDEVYQYKYQYRKGHPADANFGLVALGLYQSQDEIDKGPRQTFGTVQPGDIKYKDENGDGVIDDNDEVYIGRYQAPVSGGLQIKLSYKGATLYILGQGQSGADGFESGDYYWIEGSAKYSDVVLGSWTPQTKNAATYPRLSSQVNNNNFQQSTYWMYRTDYFQIRRIQLTVNLPKSLQKSLRMHGLYVFADASNVYQFAKDKSVINLNPGGEPFYRTFSIGLNADFK
jgi:TonB-linked SusC/RagA family outer membrane protein